MATCDEIKRTARRVYPSWTHPGCFDLSPPVRVICCPGQVGGTPRECGAWLLDPAKETVALVEYPEHCLVSDVVVSEDQGGLDKGKIPDTLWQELEKLLNLVADERQKGDNGASSVQTANAKAARNMLDKLRMERRK